MSESLLDALRRLSDACAQDDARATKALWIWTDGVFLWNEEIDRGVLEHGGVEWPMSANNREVIAAARNRLPELAHVLKEAARQIDLLMNLAIQDNAARDRLRTEIARLEAQEASQRYLEEQRGVETAELAHLQRLYKESRDYVRSLEGERDALVAAANRNVAEADCLDARVAELEEALERSLSTWCPHDPGGDGADGETYRMVRAALAKKETSP